MRDNNILTRFIKPAGRKLGVGFVNWRCFRTSHATWLVQAGADPKSVQGQMRHSRIATTLDIYAQFVPESQRRAIDKMMAMVDERHATVQAAETKPVSRQLLSELEANGSRSGERPVLSNRKFGGASRDRTDDLIVANDALSQLSYSPWLR